MGLKTLCISLLVGSLLVQYVYFQAKLEEEKESLEEEKTRVNVLEKTLTGLDRRLNALADRERLVKEIEKTPAAGVLTEDDPIHGRRLSLTRVETKMAATKDTGCVSVDLSAGDQEIDLSTLACNGHQCPPCWIISDASGGSRGLKLRSCSTAKMSNTVNIGTAGIGNLPSHSWMLNAAYSITVLNIDAANDVNIEGADGDNSFSLTSLSSVVAFCYSNSNNKILWPVRYSSGGSSGGPVELSTFLTIQSNAPAGVDISGGGNPESNIFVEAMSANHFMTFYRQQNDPAPKPRAATLIVTNVLGPSLSASGEITPTTYSGWRMSGGMVMDVSTADSFSGTQCGQVQADDNVGIYCARFEWDGTTMPTYYYNHAQDATGGGYYANNVVQFAGPVSVKDRGAGTPKGDIILCWTRQVDGAIQCRNIELDATNAYSHGNADLFYPSSTTDAPSRLRLASLATGRALLCYIDGVTVGQKTIKCRILVKEAGKTISKKAVATVASETEIMEFHLAKATDNMAVMCAYTKTDTDVKQVKCYIANVNGDTITPGPSMVAINNGEHIYDGDQIFADTTNGHYYVAFPCKPSGSEGLDILLCEATSGSIRCETVANSLNTVTGFSMMATKIRATEDVAPGSKKAVLVTIKDGTPKVWGISVN